jgi:hypothetical protein
MLLAATWETPSSLHSTSHGGANARYFSVTAEDNEPDHGRALSTANHLLPVAADDGSGEASGHGQVLLQHS